MTELKVEDLVETFDGVKCAVIGVRGEWLWLDAEDEHEPFTCHESLVRPIFTGVKKWRDRITFRRDADYEAKVRALLHAEASQLREQLHSLISLIRKPDATIDSVRRRLETLEREEDRHEL